MTDIEEVKLEGATGGKDVTEQIERKNRLVSNVDRCKYYECKDGGRYTDCCYFCKYYSPMSKNPHNLNGTCLYDIDGALEKGELV